MADEHLKSDDDVEAILRLAVQRGSNSTGDLRARLMATADELGLSEADVLAAEEAYRQEKDVQAADEVTELEDKRLWKQFRLSQRGDFISHFGSYLVVNAFLVWIDWSQGGGLSWSLWSIGGWGIGVFSHFFKLLAGVSEDNLDDFERWRSRRGGRGNPLG